eukprot:scaffold565_cov379-Pinguiococcus_pyrenoidosus.AAC.8
MQSTCVRSRSRFENSRTRPLYRRTGSASALKIASGSREALSGAPATIATTLNIARTRRPSLGRRWSADGLIRDRWTSGSADRVERWAAAKKDENKKPVEGTLGQRDASGDQLIDGVEGST